MGSIMTSRQAAELDHAFERNNWTSTDVKRLSQGKILTQLLPIVQGFAEVKLAKYIIDCDTDPVCPKGWEVVEHQKNGQFGWNPKKILLYLPGKQVCRGYIDGNNFRKEMAGKLALNANVLDYLLAYPKLIPKEWKENGKHIFFWGTIYRRTNGSFVVRFLFWDDDKWGWFYDRLVNDFGDRDPAVLLVS